jgi:hypothetical protein
MPNKTIYIKDADLPIWEKAQKELGESISSAFVDYLKDRFERVDAVTAIDALLAEVKSVHSLEVERHPAWSPIILAADSLNIGYKLYAKRVNPNRVISLLVHPLNFDDKGYLNAGAKDLITREVLEFWGGGNSEGHKLVDATSWRKLN